ncbi:MAG: ParA family protein [Mycobacterium sp.]|nr:MAG: ParA family protein [Mycobacterium sp.]
MKIAFAHTKGGVGKTTCALCLAEAAARAGFQVRVIDADPQGSASSWADRAAAAGTPLSFDVVPMTDPAALRALTSSPHELVFIDTPPGTADTIDAAIDTADLVIIPCGARPADVDRVFPTLDITAHRPTTVLLTLVDMRQVEADEIPKALTALDVPLMRNVVRDRTAISRSFGRSIPRYLGDYADVFDELITELTELGLEKMESPL